MARRISTHPYSGRIHGTPCHIIRNWASMVLPTICPTPSQTRARIPIPSWRGNKFQLGIAVGLAPMASDPHEARGSLQAWGSREEQACLAGKSEKRMGCWNTGTAATLSSRVYRKVSSRLMTRGTAKSFGSMTPALLSAHRPLPTSSMESRWLPFSSAQVARSHPTLPVAGGMPLAGNMVFISAV